MDKLTASVTAAGARLQYTAAEHAEKYRITDADGNLVGYSETASFTDGTFRFGDKKTYTVAAYASGACIGDGAKVTVESDADGDGALTLHDALILAEQAKRGGAALAAADMTAMLETLTK